MTWWRESYSAALLSASISTLVSVAVAKFTVKNRLYHEKIKDICDKTEDIVLKAGEYWSKAGNDENLERVITCQLHSINLDTLDLKEGLRKKNNVERKLRRLRREVTYGSFESPQKLSEPGRINMIKEYADDFMAAVKKCLPSYF